MNPFDYCFEQVTQWDRMRALSLRYAPKGTQDGALALYALNLELAKVAPLVTEPTLAEIRFLWWQEALHELQAGAKTRNHPVVLAVEEAAGDHKNVLGDALKLLDGWRYTSQQERLTDWQALESCLEATHGRLAEAVLGLAAATKSALPLPKAFALAWGYASLRQALLAKGDLDLLPEQARLELGLKDRANPLDIAEQELKRRACRAYEALQTVWQEAAAHQRALLATARLIPSRLAAPERSESLAAWRLFIGQFGRQLPPIRTP